tara:strand:- start:354 stop:746 length:393 start_codon:yes stop_codon:yes gene_type:complete
MNLSNFGAMAADILDNEVVAMGQQQIAPQMPVGEPAPQFATSTITPMPPMPEMTPPVDPMMEGNPMVDAGMPVMDFIQEPMGVIESPAIGGPLTSNLQTPQGPQEILMPPEEIITPQQNVSNLRPKGLIG